MSTQFKILIGILFTLATLVVLIVVGVNEENRMTRQQQTFAGRSVERGAEYFATYCYTCHGERGEGVVGLGPPLNRTDLLDTKKVPYLRAIRFGGTLSDFLHDTIAAGRPQPSQFYASQHFPNTMPTWSQDYGGPLRPDQIDSLVAYILNWAPGEVPPIVLLTTTVTAAPGQTPNVSPTPSGTPVAGVIPPFPVPPSADIIAAGKAVYDQKDKCTACHGPNLDGNTQAGQALPVHPRNFTDCTAMQQFPIANHYNAVKNGKPPYMPAWGDKLSDEQIWQVVMYERSVCQLFTP